MRTEQGVLIHLTRDELLALAAHLDIAVRTRKEELVASSERPGRRSSATTLPNEERILTLRDAKGCYSSVEQVLNALESEATPAEARAVLEQLEAADCGEFKVERRGWPTCFIWNVDAILAGRVAEDESVDMETPNERGLAPNMIEVPFPLRNALVVHPARGLVGQGSRAALDVPPLASQEAT